MSITIVRERDTTCPMCVEKTVALTTTHLGGVQLKSNYKCRLCGYEYERIEEYVVDWTGDAVPATVSERRVSDGNRRTLKVKWTPSLRGL